MFEPFCGTFEVEEIDSAIDLDAVILGAPFEDDIPFYPKGTNSAPMEIRKNSQFYSGQGLTRKSIHDYNILDWGNLKEKLSYNVLQEQLSEKVNKILAKNAMPIILGGDHSIALGTAKGIALNYHKIDSLIWIDAHLDVMNEYPEGSKFTRATVLRRIIDLEIFEPKSIYYLGIRGHNLGLEELEFIEEKGIAVLNSNDLSDKENYKKFIQQIMKKHESFYISLDMDVLDPSFAPGVSVPEPGGISPRELIDIIRLLAKKTKCFELVEVNPEIDINGLTSKLACKMIFELMDSK